MSATRNCLISEDGRIRQELGAWRGMSDGAPVEHDRPIREGQYLFRLLFDDDHRETGSRQFPRRGQKFVDDTVPQAQFRGLTIPDPGMKRDAEGHWRYSEIDWEEFKQVLAGNGPCNRDRMAARRKAHDDGAWVREAAGAYAEKRRNRQLAQAAE